MDERRLTHVKILHRGVPIGEGSLMLYEPSDQDAEPDFFVRDVRSLPAFDAVIAPAMRRHREEEATWIRLPYPAASEAETRMHDAWDVVCALWQELELQDEAGAVVPIPVQGFNGHVCSLATWEAPAGVLARLADRYLGGGSDTEPPAV
jgi:hypothetical protein